LRDIGDAWDRLDEAETPVAVSPSTSRLTLILAGALLAALSTLSFLYFSQKTTTEHVLRADIAAPDGASSLHSFAISPNGRAVVIAAVVNGKRQLWLRPMDALQAQPLPNTEDATYPFWSPDSSRIGFFAQGSLKKIAVSGGLPEALCTVPDARGGSWGRTDVILFGSSLGGRVLIQRVPASCPMVTISFSSTARGKEVGSMCPRWTARKPAAFFPTFLPPSTLRLCTHVEAGGTCCLFETTH
jgi:hypothetical protein